MRTHPVPLFVVAWIAALTALAALVCVAAPAAATPSKNSTCTSCHTGAASGTVTAVPSTATPAPGATYTVAINIGLTASGKTGYHIAQTDAAGSATTWMAVYSGTSSQTAWTATMTAPATPGAYYYKVWTAKGYSGMAKAVNYSITVPAPAATPAIASLSPAQAQTGASVVIAGSNLGTSGTVKFGATTATSTAWSASQVTATVPASLAPGATTVTVQPAGAAVSNALAFTVTTVPAPVPGATITSLSPAQAQTGASVVIAGSNLGTSGTVKFGATTATSTAWSASQVTATVPASLAPGATAVTVQPAGADVSNALAFTVTTVPVPVPGATITSLSPAQAQTGASVVIAGTDLGASGVVQFGATTATTTAWSSTSVTVTVPAGLAPGATTLTVTPTGGSSSNALTFTVDAPPAPADTTDPVTTASGVPGVAWCNYPVTVSLSATDETGGSGVQSISYVVDGGAPVVAEGAAASVLLETSGIHTVAFFAKDAAGNAEAMQSLTVNLDLSNPRPQARSATARHKRTVTLRYRIVDAAPNGGAATVTIVVKNSRGKTVKRLELGSRPVNRTLKATFACRLRPGDYRFRVSATDAAGNQQAAVASQRLRVLAR